VRFMRGSDGPRLYQINLTVPTMTPKMPGSRVVPFLRPVGGFEPRKWRPSRAGYLSSEADETKPAFHQVFIRCVVDARQGVQDI
jgi:hypothetical protein